jgi:hypothetical protein
MFFVGAYKHVQTRFHMYRITLNSVVFFLALFFTTIAQAQTNISGVINTYAKVTNVTSTTITVSTLSGAVSAFNAGNYAIIMQMKGANVDNSSSSSFGKINSLNNAGNYEFVQIQTVSGSGPYTFTISQALFNSYTTSDLVQLISVPRYTQATVNGTLTALAWSESSGYGGVLALHVEDTLFLQANITANGLGFRGGVPNTNNSNNGAANDSSLFVSDLSTSGRGAEKGESIAFSVSTKEAGRAALAAGGGGSATHNGGGGGGSNYTVGGVGGLGWSGAGGLRPAGGRPGYTLPYDVTTNRFFLGSGGGGGQQNNGVASSGGRGGGIILIRAKTLAMPCANKSSITANGANASNSGGNDGAGGGGGGGLIYIDVLSYSLPCKLIVSASGGNGGQVQTGTAHGGGGGGGIGPVITAQDILPDSVTNITTVGIAGRDCNGGGCTASGNPGQPATTPTITRWTPNGLQPPLPVELLSFTGSREVGGVELRWDAASERNFIGYSIERSYDNQSFESKDFVVARGTNDDITTYNHIDPSPSDGYNYYRLKLLDVDGTFKYSNVLEISPLTNGLPTVTATIYPNPAHDATTLKLAGGITTAEVQIVDAVGRVWKNLSLGTLSESGVVTKQDTLEEELNISELPFGLYFVQVALPQGTQTLRLVRY